jgi:hypothetical protein
MPLFNHNRSCAQKVVRWTLRAYLKSFSDLRPTLAGAEMAAAHQCTALKYTSLT